MHLTRNAVLILGGALFVVFGKAVTAQTSFSEVRLQIGARVRVSSSTSGRLGSAWVGTVLAQHGDTLLFQPEGTQDSLTLALGSTTQLEVSSGTHSHVGQGMGLGFLAGASIGALLGVTTYTPSNCFVLCGPGVAAAADGLAGGLLGTIVGGFMGARHTENWERVPVTADRVGVRIAPWGKAGLMVSATF
ncbi:MAG: hypothetical protein M3Z18_03045 [Gemmatimonadota bacterium]|nr:hypothetical protein [Gemmatimonadota bacterium]